MAVVIPLLAVALAGCVDDELTRDEDDANREAPAIGTIMAFARGGETPSEVGSLSAVVSRVEAHAEAAASSATTDDGSSDATARSTASAVVVIVDEDKTIDLEEDEDFIGQADVDAGVFRSLVIVIDGLRVEPEDEDREIVLELEGLRITVTGDFIVRPDETTQVLVELDAARAVVGSGGLECPEPQVTTTGGDGFDADVTVDERRVQMTNIDITVIQTLVVTDADVTNVVINDFDEDEARDADDPELEAEAERFRTETRTETRIETEDGETEIRNETRIEREGDSSGTGG